MSTIISLSQLSVHYQQFQALKEISATLSQGSIGILGPNGAGKSTLIRTLLGLQPYSSGEVKVLGKKVREEPLEIRRKIGYAPEGDTFLPGISAVQFVAFLAELVGVKQKTALKRAHEVLEYVELGEERYRTLEQLSHGQRSRVKLAQALCHDVELLILDEPTDGMDPAGRENFLMLLKRVKEQGNLSILLASHTLEDVEFLCDQILLIQNGEILAEKKLSELMQKSENSYVLLLSKSTEEFLQYCSQEGISGEKYQEKRIFMKNIEDPRIIFQFAHKLGSEVLELSPWNPTLESIFVKMVKENNS